MGFKVLVMRPFGKIGINMFQLPDNICGERIKLDLTGGCELEMKILDGIAGGIRSNECMFIETH